MPPPGKDTFIWVSGPEVMEIMVGKQLGELGYPGERKFATRGKFYFHVLVSTFFGFVKKLFTCRFWRKKNE